MQLGIVHKERHTFFLPPPPPPMSQKSHAMCNVRGTFVTWGEGAGVNKSQKKGDILYGQPLVAWVKSHRLNPDFVFSFRSLKCRKTKWRSLGWNISI